MRTSRTTVVQAVFIALTSLTAACVAPPAEEIETTQQALTTGTAPLFFPHAIRFMTWEWDNRCETWCDADQMQDGYFIPGTCSTSCKDQFTKIILHDVQNNPTPFDAYINPTSRIYLGCGPQAVQSMVAWYGDYLPLQQVAQYVPSVHIPFVPHDPNAITTSPNSLRDGMRNLLNSRGYQVSTVTRTSGVQSFTNVVVEQLSSGNPVVAQVKEGDHWVVVTGFEYGTPNRFYTIDYGSPGLLNGWFTEQELGFQGWGGLIPQIFSGSQGWSPRTVVTTSVSYDPSRPPSPYAWCPNVQSCGEYQSWNPSTCECQTNAF